MGEEVSFIDAEQYTGKGDDKLTFKQLIMEHLRKISNISTKEFRGGYWEETTNNGTLVDKKYVPDSREEYINAVDWLYDVLYCRFDKEMKEFADKFKSFEEKEQRELYNRYSQYDDNKQDYIPKEYAEEFKTEIVRKITRRLFREICSFLYRENYLDVGSYSDEVK